MPIKPENRARYPADWPQIRVQRLELAGHQCEWPGCMARHRELGYWRREEWVGLPRALRDAGVVGPCTIASSEGPLRILRIVLTIAHLDHQPENCEPENLRAWCQRHHLAYDADHHRQTAYATRRARANTLELFA